MRTLIDQLRALLTPREKWKSLGLLVLMTVGAGLELTAMGLLMPVVVALTKPELFDQNVWLRHLRALAPGMPDRAFLIAAALAAALMFVGKNVYQLLLTRGQSRFVLGLAGRLAGRLFARYLAAPYAYHLRTHSTACINNVNRVTAVFNSVFWPLLNLLSELLIMAAMLGAMLFFAPWMSLGIAAALGGLSLAAYHALKRRNDVLGAQLRAEHDRVAKTMFQAIGGLKEITVLGRLDAFADRFDVEQRREKRCLARSQSLAQAPRFFIESLVVALVMAAIAASGAAGVADGTILLRFALLAMAMFRMMPSLSRVQYNLSTIRQHLGFLTPIHRELTAPPPAPARPPGPPLAFTRAVTVEHVAFAYEGAAAPLFTDVSLTLPRLSTTALVGATGGGKTTLVDLILGFLEPQSGRVAVDGRDIRENRPSWLARVGYVPQAPFMLDDTIRANVAFGLPDDAVDDAAVERALRMAQAWDFIEALPDGTRATTGEAGARLSGGQRQRIAIARALYRGPEVLILDEATSALDLDTERAFADALASLRGKLTILLVAHRPATVELCERVVRVQAPVVEVVRG